MVQELLEKRDILGDIAIEMYGEFWIANEDFWGSQTERDLNEINTQLMELGFVDEPTEEEEAFADKLIEMLIKEGKLREPGE